MTPEFIELVAGGSPTVLVVALLWWRMSERIKHLEERLIDIERAITRVLSRA